MFGQREYWKGAVYLSIILNTMLFMTWVLSIPQGGTLYWWFIFPITVTAMVLVAVHHFIRSLKLFDCFLHEYWILNLCFFLTWISFTPGEFPWFIVIFIVLALPLVIYHLRTTYNERRAWVIVALIQVDINLVLFLIWGFTDSPFPWFLIPAFASIILVGFLYYKWKKEGGSFETIGTHTPIPVQNPSLEIVDPNPIRI